MLSLITRTLLFLYTSLFSASSLLGMFVFSFLILFYLWIHDTEASELIQDSFLHGKQTSYHFYLSIRTWMEFRGKKTGSQPVAQVCVSVFCFCFCFALFFREREKDFLSPWLKFFISPLDNKSDSIWGLWLGVDPEEGFQGDCFGKYALSAMLLRLTASGF